MILVTAEQMRRLDHLTIEHGTPGYTLMERAGSGAATMLLETFPHVVGKRVLVLAGKGNNGGDGFIVARVLRRKRVKVEVALLASASSLSGDAAQAFKAYRRAGGAFFEAVVDLSDRSDPSDTSDGLAEIATRLEKATLVVDALFGTGLNAPLTGVMAELVELVNASGVPVFAIDIPSGIHADRGVPLGTAIQAEATATFGFAKVGQVVYPGATHVGTLGVIDIGIHPQAIAEVAPRGRWLDAECAAALVPRRAPESHKGTTGHVLVVAGSRGHSGAALMCSHACARVGAGLTTLAGPASLNTIFSLGRPEVMTATLPDEDGEVHFDEPAVRSLLKSKSAVVVGPGLGTHEDARRLVCFLIEESRLPTVLDADALSCIAQDLSVLRRAQSPLILTPHPGEMARLLGSDSAAVQGDRFATARDFAREHGCVLVLKGARTIIAAPDGAVWVSSTGNPAMASGGMGDALAGMIGGLLAQGLSPSEAACLAVYSHGEIADYLAAARGKIGLLASDVIEGIPAGLQRLVDGDDAAANSRRSTTARPRRRRS